jgi:naphthoate synthase/2-ketocyclohexanecarboxyl-CoA hydrolase
MSTHADYTDIQWNVESGVATITINRPEVHNAIRDVSVEELIHAFDRADDDPDVGVIVLTGAGDRAFCTGGDIGFEDRLDPEEGRRFGRILMRLSQTMRGSGKPIIAKIRGWCVGGGNELNLLCDLSVAADTARFGHTGPRMGSVPIWYGTQLMPHLVGEKRAKEIIMLCEKYSANQAEAMGWINRSVPEDSLDELVDGWCQTLLSRSPQSLRLTKFSIDYESDKLWPSVRSGFEVLNYIHGTDEFHEGTTAFLQKREPNFRHRNP